MTWIKADDDIPRGTKGKIISFKESKGVQRAGVRFENGGSFALKLTELVLVPQEQLTSPLSAVQQEAMSPQVKSPTPTAAQAASTAVSESVTDGPTLYSFALILEMDMRRKIHNLFHR